MRIYKRPNSPYWWYDFTVAEARHRASTLRDVKSDARKVAEEAFRRALDASQLGVREVATLEHVIDRYLDDPHVTGQADYRNVASRCNKLIARGDTFRGRFGLEGDAPFEHAVTTRTVAALRAARLREGNSEATANREIVLLQTIYNRCNRVWDITVAPDVRFERGKEQRKLRFLTLEEEEAFFDQINPFLDRIGLAPYGKRAPLIQRQLQDQYDLSVFLLDTGCRYSEITSLTWDCIEADGTINLYRTKTGNESRLTPTQRLAPVIDRRRRATNSPYIFPGSGRRTETRGHATKGIMRAFERAGINTPAKVDRFGKATTHTFRHTFASRLVMAGVSLFKVQALLGHSSPEMTMRYAHLAPDNVSEEAAGVLDALRA